ncbi:MAG: GntR family transcriptional regulator [Anaerolineales bacterium]|nr:MAG: GntR family transcriptional regulator [Anaerolineales bacterium]
MEGTYLYEQIAEAVRQEILSGQLKPGDRLPTIRQMTRRWDCTAGTVQRAYQELTRQGLVVSRAGQGTRIVEHPPALDETPLRRVTLVHRAEAFLLEVLTSGYSPAEVEEAVRQALDRWRTETQQPIPQRAGSLRFAGSHDLVLTWLAGHFEKIAPGTTLQLTFSGSLGGLIALGRGQADLAGCHLWDSETGTYNLPFVRRLLPGVRVALAALAYRRLGLILPPGNPTGVSSLADLAQAGQRFANRQSGSGTRVWLDAQLHKLGLQTDTIMGYSDERLTHSEVAQAVAEGEAQVGLGLEAAARNYGLDFIPLTNERYDLVIPAAGLETPAMAALLDWLRSPASKDLMRNFGGYETDITGSLEWIEAG